MKHTPVIAAVAAVLILASAPANAGNARYTPDRVDTRLEARQDVNNDGFVTVREKLHWERQKQAQFNQAAYRHNNVNRVDNWYERRIDVNNDGIVSRWEQERAKRLRIRPGYGYSYGKAYGVRYDMPNCDKDKKHNHRHDFNNKSRGHGYGHGKGHKGKH